MTSLLAYSALGTLLAVIGLIDDQRNLRILFRFGAQFAVALGILLVTGVPTQLLLPFVGSLLLPAPVLLVLLVIWLVGFTNMFNFMDGIDGIAGTQAAVAAGGWFVVCLLLGQIDLALITLLIASSCVGFLLLNWSPARVFMGDIGSLFLGFTLAAFPLLLSERTANPRLLIVGALFVLPFLFDASLTVLRRLRNRENVLKPHKSHLYQRMVHSGRPHREVTLLYGLLALIHVVNGLLYLLSSSEAIMLLTLIVALGVQIGLVVYATRVERTARNTQPVN